MINTGESDRIGIGSDRCCVVIFCKGCCCGTAKKHPGVRQLDQIMRLRSFSRTLVRTSKDCLGTCAHSNVVVVHPSPVERRRGAKPVWLGFVTDDTVVDSIGEWVSKGGPGRIRIPDILALHEIRPPARPHPTGRTRQNRG